MRLIVVAALLVLGGCTANPGYNMVGGAAGGAAAGAAIGCLATIPIGCAPGAGVGAIIGAGAGSAMGLMTTPPRAYYAPY